MLIVSLITVMVLIFIGLIVMLRRIMTQNLILATQHLDELNQEYTEKEKRAAEGLDAAKKKAQEIIVQAQDEADAARSKIIKDAEAERDRLQEQTRSQCDQMIQQADRSRQILISEQEERIAKEGITKACELIQYALPGQLREDAHAHWVKELVETGFVEIKNLRIPDDLHEAKVTSAFALSDGERNAIKRKLKEVLARDIVLKEEVSEKVVAGIIIMIGSIVLDGSLKTKIQVLAKGAKAF